MMEILEIRVKSHEGNPGKIYRDSKGFLSCGWGHLLYEGSRVPLEAAEAFFRQDMKDAFSSFMTILPAKRRKLNTARVRVIIELLFAMNLQKVLQFKKMWEAIEKDDWEEAGAQLLDSDWARTVGDKPPSASFPKGQRAWELANILAKGVDNEENSAVISTPV